MDLIPSILFALFSLSEISYANDNCGIKNTTDKVIECILNKHPELQISNKEIDVAKGNLKLSSQLLNPSLEWEFNESQRASGLSSEINLKYKFELGSKRAHRKKLARVQKSLADVAYIKSYNKIKIDLIISLYRLRQIEHETEVMNENKSTFSLMISQYKKIGRMNPEQEISVNIFSMASQEVNLKLQNLQNERDQILSKLEVMNGGVFIPQKKQLPPIDHTWPKLNESKLEGALTQEADLKVLESKKNYSLEKSKVWPNLAIGPRLVSSPNPEGNNFWGGSLSLDLPLLNLNRGGIQKAQAIRAKAELSNNLLRKEILSESKKLKSIYQRSSVSFNRALQNSKHHQNHNRTHSLIKRGLVSPPLVIELHRQSIEFYEALHQQELAAVKARWDYYSLFYNLDKKTIAATEGGVK